MQIRTLVDMDKLFEALLSEAMPYLFKRYYFRLLFEVYINEVPYIVPLYVLQDRFILILKYILLDDLK